MSRLACCLVLAAALCGLAACGGGGDAPLPMIGAAGGVVDGPAGARVSVPAGALSADTPIALAASSAGAPPMDAGFRAGGEVFALTPHGTSFAQPVTVRLPVDATRVPAGFTPTLYKTDAQGAWQAVPGATVAGGFVTAQVTSFSWFAFGALPPTITTQPADVSVTAPATATFGVTALGSPPFSYQWQRSDDGGATWADLAGATQRSYTTPATRAGGASAGGDDGARLRVVVSNPDGPSTSQAATLHVSVAAAAPTITGEPADVAVAPGADAAFSVQVAENGVAYQWQRSNDGGASWADLPGQTNASLLLVGVQAADSGALLRVHVTLNGAGSTSRSATLTVTGGGAGPGAGPEIAAGRQWSLARLNNGTLLAWGEDAAGTLGNGPAGSGATPGPIAGPSDVVAVAAAYYHGAALTRGGEVWSWGSNGFGELGNDDNNNAPTPVRLIGASPASRYQAISLGTSHTLLLRTDGRLEATGFNGTGALGQPDGVYFVDTALELPGAARYTAIAAGAFFSLALRDDGTLWGFGSNDAGQLGNGFNTPPPVRGMLQQVTAVPNGLRAIAAGTRHALAIDLGGQVWAWGETSNGKLGIGPTVTAWAPPQRVQLSGNFIAVAAGEQHSLALRDDGVVFAWGIDETGQLGQGRSLGASAVPLAVTGLPGRMRSIAAGGALGHSLAVGEDGRVWAWGHNNFGQLGQPTGTSSSNVPVLVPGLNLN
ncbi:MAG: hypothetical protein KF788_11755 [Piscinibacter sp.]|nr:hypothetical protein [Piscinibacter sp.]